MYCIHLTVLILLSCQLLEENFVMHSFFCHLKDTYIYYQLWVQKLQGCGLRQITRSPKVPNHEILGAQHLSLYEKSKFFQSPKGKS